MALDRRRVAGALGAALLCLAPLPAAAGAVDLELVLAVDTSASINDYEFRIQMEGYAAAFRHPDVHRAIDRAGDRGIAVAVVQWAGGGQPVLAVGWMLLRDAEGAGRFAERIAAAARHDSGDLTAIGDAILFSLARLADNRLRVRAPDDRHLGRRALQHGRVPWVRRATGRWPPGSPSTAS